MGDRAIVCELLLFQSVHARVLCLKLTRYVRIHSAVCAFNVSWISQQDVHDRYRTEAHQDVVARFNQR